MKRMSLLLVAFGLVLLADTSMAQSGSSSVRGIVTDPQRRHGIAMILVQQTVPAFDPDLVTSDTQQRMASVPASARSPLQL